MTIEELRTTPTVQLMSILKQAEIMGEQDMINVIAYELTCRLYVPYSGADFDSILGTFGFKQKEPDKQLKKTNTPVV